MHGHGFAVMFMVYKPQNVDGLNNPDKTHGRVPRPTGMSHVTCTYYVMQLVGNFSGEVNMGVKVKICK